MDAIFHFGLFLGLFYVLIICLCFAKDYDNKKENRGYGHDREDDIY